MLSREELRLLNNLLKDEELEGDAKKLQTKLGLIIEQIDIMEKAQKDAAEIQDKIVALDGDKNEKEES